MRRLSVASLAVVATLAFAAAPTAHADEYHSAYKVPCSMVLPGSEGNLVGNWGSNYLANCRYPGPAEGGGVEPVFPGNQCFITPAGNFQCAGVAHPRAP